MAKKRCKYCKEYFDKETGVQYPAGFFCSKEHAVKWSIENAQKKREKEQAAKEKEARAKIRKAKERIKTRAEHLREAQAAFNAYIRERDKDLPCISCGRHHQGQYHAGHYLSVGAHPEMRFDEKNVHKQCSPCNNHLSGNIVNYRKGLIERYGQEIVDYLEGQHDMKKYTIDEIKEIKTKYRGMTKELKAKDST